MSWRRTTFALVGACMVLCAWVLLRDRNAPVLFEPARAEAQLDANRMLTALTHASCTAGCTAEVLGRAGSESWRIRIAAPRWQHCFVINVVAFGQTAARGFTGMQPMPCPA